MADYIHMHPYSNRNNSCPPMCVMVQVEEAVAAAQSAAAANLGRMDEAAQKAAQAAQDVSQAQQRIEAEKTIADAERVARAASPILDEDEVSVALEALGAFVEHPITKEDDKEVARVLQDYGSWEDERVAKVVADLVAHRKSERERRKREFFASKRGAEQQGGGPSSAASTSADDATSSYDAAAAAGPDGEEEPEQFKARLAMVAASKSADHTTMQAALDGAQAYQDGPLAEQFEQLQTRLQEVCPTPPIHLPSSSLDSSNTTTVLPSC